MKTIDNIIITKSDQTRIRNYFAKNKYGFELRNNLKIVEEKLYFKPVDSKKVPPTVVTMNSKVKVKNLMLNKSFELELVYPDAVDVSNQKISIFSPIGASMFGHSQGSEFAWAGQNGKIKFTIEKIVYQPESAGDYHL
ncbi:GreA/GreB family elongation factor [Lunatibacter salilacus]|uniref:GreA/GreB family elongation factor n=1 Tax=Lunatibacter salilacus TaxID=2483804 RepID=UPI00131DE583|nr:GreA/GreB family elongation factor [Lunatibacter salilacus]